MDESPSVPSETPTPQPEGRGIGTRLKAVSKRTWILVGVAVAVLLFFVLADVVTSSPLLCGSCHAMKPRTAAWEASAHAQVKCVQCHQKPHAWYGTPLALVRRTGLIARDVYWQASGKSTASAETTPTGTASVTSENCLQCHDVNRRATSGFRILIDHPEHAKRNGSCLSCHENTAHPVSTRGRPLTLMSQCMTCHGTAEQPKASAECSVCHPSDYELVPASHKQAKWKNTHGEVATSDPTQCEMCHEPAFCTDCHGLQMPHPKGWERSSGHPAFAKKDRAVCERCHTEKPDLCSMCHHKAYDPTKGTWVQQHYIQVRNEGAAFCMQCHSALFCTDCHARLPQQ